MEVFACVPLDHELIACQLAFSAPRAGFLQRPLIPRQP
jgi:hypothetical protein